MEDLNVKPKATKLLEENTGSKLSDISLSNILSVISPQARGTREKKNQLGLYQTKMILHSKGSHQQNKETAYQLEEDFHQ